MRGRLLGHNEISKRLLFRDDFLDVCRLSVILIHTLNRVELCHVLITAPLQPLGGADEKGGFHLHGGDVYVVGDVVNGEGGGVELGVVLDGVHREVDLFFTCK